MTLKVGEDCDLFALHSDSLFDTYSDDYNNEECSGALVVYHSPVKDPYSLRSFRLVSEKYSHLRSRLRRRTVISITMDGDCCWRLWTRIKFRGRSKILRPGDDYSTFRVSSVERLASC